jgi:hypothetical protein
VRGRPLSYRRRRRLVTLVVVVAVAGGVAAAIVLLPRGHKLDRGPTSPSPAASAAGSHRRPRPLQLTAADRDHLRTTIALFVSTSVARHHPERSWAVVHPVLREGLTKRQWSTGNIPVIPYPAAGVDLFTLQSAVDRTVLMEVMLEPPQDSKLVRKTFQIELRRAPRALHGWLVSSWVPEGVSESQIQKDASTDPVVASQAQHFSGIWLVVLIGVLGGGVILIPTGMIVGEAYRFRRAKAKFRRSLDEPDEPDELPR